MTKFQNILRFLWQRIYSFFSDIFRIGVYTQLSGKEKKTGNKLLYFIVIYYLLTFYFDQIASASLSSVSCSIARTWSILFQCGQNSPTSLQFSVILFAGQHQLRCHKWFGPGANWSLEKGQEFHLLTVPKTHGTALSLQPLLLLLLANTLGYPVIENTKEITFQMGSCLFFFSYRKVARLWCRSFQKKFIGASLWTMTWCSRKAFGTMHICIGLCPQGLVAAHTRRSSLQCLVATGTDGVTLYNVVLS